MGPNERNQRHQSLQALRNVGLRRRSRRRLRATARFWVVGFTSRRFGFAGILASSIHKLLVQQALYEQYAIGIMDGRYWRHSGYGSVSIRLSSRLDHPLGRHRMPPDMNKHEDIAKALKARPGAPKTRSTPCLRSSIPRASPVHTAVRNCTRDEGGPFEVGNQVPISNHCKLLSSKAMVVSVAVNVGTNPSG
jgi:hypothetical protein